MESWIAGAPVPQDRRRGARARGPLLHEVTRRAAPRVEAHSGVVYCVGAAI